MVIIRLTKHYNEFDIKDCPFCGSNELVLYKIAYDNKFYTIEICCDNCGVCVHFYTFDNKTDINDAIISVISKWNIRNYE